MPLQVKPGGARNGVELVLGSVLDARRVDLGSGVDSGAAVLV